MLGTGLIGQTVLWSQREETKIAFIADAHFADVYPDLHFLDTADLPKIENGEALLIRSMEAQLHSTRLFNENYFALTAALDDVINRGVKIIAMPGDFSDDGQPVHIKGLNSILKNYSKNHGISFFMINGNHDPTRPYGEEGGKRDFLGANGKAQPIMSKDNRYSPDLEKENSTLVLEDLKEWGYKGIIEELSDYGFFPNEKYLFWETPFSSYGYEQYTFKLAFEASKFTNRSYNFDMSETVVPDVSYLVEPVNGLWLLALDANVYLPNENTSGFSGTGIGYNQVLMHKKYLIEWTQKIIKEAERLGKTVIAFSHYPMIDFNDGATNEMKKLFGNDAFQAYRIPDQLVGEIFADIGLKIHIGGHMHLNDTGVFTSKKGNTLVNVQTPSLAAYPPGYKIVTIKEHSKIKIETVVLDSVAKFDSFFDWYKKENHFLRENFPESSWDEDVMASDSYLEFTKAHLQELVRLRFLPDDWPIPLQEELLNKSGWQLLMRANIMNHDMTEFKSLKSSEKELSKALKKNQLTKTDFKNWNGQDLILDFYRFRNADQLALRDISDICIRSYQLFFKLLLDHPDDGNLSVLKQFAIIFQKQMTGESAVNFELDLGNNRID